MPHTCVFFNHRQVLVIGEEAML